KTRCDSRLAARGTIRIIIGPVIRHDLRDSKDPELDSLAEMYHLHPLHIEDCRQGNQRAKVEEGEGYIFVVLKPVHVNKSGETTVTDLDLFIGPDYVITVEEGECPTVRKHFDELHAHTHQMRPDQLFYRLFDGVVDAYAPPIDWFNDTIDR